MRIAVFHNILWSKYKGGVFSELYKLEKATVQYSFFQIASSSGQRQGLASIDVSYHKYPYELFYDGSYDDVSKIRMSAYLFWRVLTCRAQLVIIPGYHAIEYWFMLLACILTGKKRAVFVDSTRLDNPKVGWKDSLKRLFFRFCNGFFCYGTRSSEYLCELGVPKQKIHIRCQAAALPHDYDVMRVMPARQKRAADKGAFTYLYVGRLSPEKGLDTLLQAFSALVAQDKNLRLIIVGSGPIQKELMKLSNELDLDNIVSFPGAAELAQLESYYLGADCMVLPSRSEPWGLVANEALSYGCPIVVSDNCGCAPDLVVEGMTGYTFKTNDVSSLAQAMLQIKHNFGRDSYYTAACLQQISKYSPDIAAQQIDTGCREIIGINK